MTETGQSDDGEGDGVGMTGGFAEDPQGGAGGEEPSSQDPSSFTNYPGGESQGEAETPGAGESPGEGESEGESEGEGATQGEGE